MEQWYKAVQRIVAEIDHAIRAGDGENMPQPDTLAVCHFSENRIEKQIYNVYFSAKFP